MATRVRVGWPSTRPSSSTRARTSSTTGRSATVPRMVGSGGSSKWPDRIGRPDSYRARARASASASIGSVSSGAYPESLLRRSGTVRTFGPVDPVARERPETGAQHRRHGLAPGADVLTSCLPCHPHPLTRSFTALPSTASALLSRDAGRGAVGRREATRGSLLTRFSARLDRQSMVEDLVGIPSALRFLEFLVVPAVVQLGPWD